MPNKIIPITKKTIGELLLIIGGFILAETIIRNFLSLAEKALIPMWVLTLMSISIIINGVELINGKNEGYGGIIADISIISIIISLVLFRNNLINGNIFTGIIFCSLIITPLFWFFGKIKKNIK